MLETMVFLPLISFLLAGIFGNGIGDRGTGVLTSMLVVIAAGIAWINFLSGSITDPRGYELIELGRWIDVGGLSVSWSLRLDNLTVIMSVVVTTISALVHVYSIGYMRGDPHLPRFFAYLSLFTFAMLMLVMANDFAQMFVGWEGVGLASYLLIGFWHKRPSASSAAIKAFIVNRIGDFGFILGICAVFTLFGALDFPTVFAKAPDMVGQQLAFLWFNSDALTLICLLLFVGAMGKSAQLFLHTWLPDAMEGPTPVSALIHAATMVTAGIFMVARLSPLFELSPDASSVMAIIGAATAFFASTVALVQTDIKRVVAYSTCSQLGYMVAALGIGAYSLAIFHLFTHAFFKALLFLGSGSVIHAMSDEQDIRKMGGLGRLMPWTYATMLIATLALTGVGIPLTTIGFAGYVSKDAIIESSFVAVGSPAQFAFVMLVISALFTSFYSWRLIHLTFHGRSRATAQALKHAHEAPKVMLIPLVLLACGSIFAGTLFYSLFVGEGFATFWGWVLPEGSEQIIEQLHHRPWWIALVPTIMMVIGFVVAYYFYIISPETPRRLARANPVLYRFLLNKWYFDEIYHFLFVAPTLVLARLLWKGGDEGTVDRFGPDGIAFLTLKITQRMVKLQTGYVYHYAFAMLVGAAAIVTWVIFAGGGN